MPEALLAMPPPPDERPRPPLSCPIVLRTVSRRALEPLVRLLEPRYARVFRF
jgi:hypothetical protein